MSCESHNIDYCETCLGFDLANSLREEATLKFISQVCVICPHCGEGNEIVELNCTIFRCGATTAGQLNPHENEQLVSRTSLTMGCGKQYIYKGSGAPLKCTGM